MSTKEWSSIGHWLGDNPTIYTVVQEDGDEPILRIGEFTINTDLKAEHIDLDAMELTILKLRKELILFCDENIRLINDLKREGLGD